MKFIPNSPDARTSMLKEIGAASVEELFGSIPESVRLKELLRISPPVSEFSLMREMKKRSADMPTDTISFLGAGSYRRYIPEAIGAIASRAEFLTCYTPYQPELSQGSLQVMFEFQTLLSQLTGMDVANASMYEGATAAAEALFMAQRVKKKRDRVLYSAALHPEYIETLKTYTRHQDIELAAIPLAENGQTDLAAMERELDDKTLCALLPTVNFYGVIEDQKRQGELLTGSDVLFVSVVTEMSSLGLLTPPGAFGADIVVGEAQSLGLPVSYGGPNLGIFACAQKYVRQMPGRLSGLTVDKRGNRAFCLTLSTREQHIRREKATSNICSNQALCALWVTVYLALMGRQGLKRLAALNGSKTQYAIRQIKAIKGIDLRFAGAVYNEFAIETPLNSSDLLAGLRKRNILGGVPLSRFDAKDTKGVLVNVTEVNTKEEIDCLVNSLKEILR